MKSPARCCDGIHAGLFIGFRSRSQNPSFLHMSFTAALFRKI